MLSPSRFNDHDSQPRELLMLCAHFFVTEFIEYIRTKQQHNDDVRAHTFGQMMLNIQCTTLLINLSSKESCFSMSLLVSALSLITYWELALC